MNIDELLSGLQEIDSIEGIEMGYSPKYISSTNSQIRDYKKQIVTALGLNTNAKLYGGAINLEFSDDTKLFPEDEIRNLGEEKVIEMLGGGFLGKITSFFFGRNIKALYTKFEKAKKELNLNNYYTSVSAIIKTINILKKNTCSYRV